MRTMFLPLVLVVVMVGSSVEAQENLIADRPATQPATAPTTQRAKRLGILLMDENHEEGGQEAIRAFGGNLVVNDVLVGSRAEKMGLQMLDVIRRINGKDMSTVEDVLSAVRDADLLKIEVIRQQKAITVEEKAPN